MALYQYLKYGLIGIVAVGSGAYLYSAYNDFHNLKVDYVRRQLSSEFEANIPEILSNVCASSFNKSQMEYIVKLYLVVDVRDKAKIFVLLHEISSFNFNIKYFFETQMYSLLIEGLDISNRHDFPNDTYIHGLIQILINIGGSGIETEKQLMNLEKIINYCSSENKVLRFGCCKVLRNMTLLPEVCDEVIKYKERIMSWLLDDRRMLALKILVHLTTCKASEILKCRHSAAFNYLLDGLRNDEYDPTIIFNNLFEFYGSENWANDSLGTYLKDMKVQIHQIVDANLLMCKLDTRRFLVQLSRRLKRNAIDNNN